MTVKREPSKPKIVVTVRIDEETWTNFRKDCIDKNEKYSPTLEKILKGYLDGENDEQTTGEGNEK